MKKTRLVDVLAIADYSSNTDEGDMGLSFFQNSFFPHAKQQTSYRENEKYSKNKVIFTIFHK
jgi:hypothetical protein